MSENNNKIKNIIEENNIFFIGRIAGIELLTAYDVLNNNIIDLHEDLRQLQDNAGIYVKDRDSLKLYVDKLIKSYKECTAIAKWPIIGDVYKETGQGQQLILEMYPNIPRINARELEPYYFSETDSWMTKMEGKRILIIHPFIETIRKQLTNLDKIFPNRSWFKDSSFIFLKPPITYAKNHLNIDWQDHYNNFIKEIDKNQDYYDIALIACGGYGMLVAEYIYKECKKSSMYIGGALQLFFGIIGKRWFTNKEVMSFVNDEWIRPIKEDRPPNYQIIEKGCYW
jgi:hypothetical protein